MSWPQYRHAECRFGNRFVALSRKEADVLAVLLMNRGRPVKTGDLIAAVYPDGEPEHAADCVRVFVHNLRHKLPGVIRNHTPAWGNGAQGYVIDRPK